MSRPLGGTDKPGRASCSQLPSGRCVLGGVPGCQLGPVEAFLSGGTSMPIPFTPPPPCAFCNPFPQNLELSAGPWQIYPCPNGMPDSGEAAGFLALPLQAHPVLEDTLSSLY